MRSQCEREPHLGEKEGYEREPGKKRVDSTVKEGRFQEIEERQANRSSLEEVGGNMSG